VLLERLAADDGEYAGLVAHVGWEQLIELGRNRPEDL
jgi:hypothetical protein